MLNYIKQKSRFLVVLLLILFVFGCKEAMIHKENIAKSTPKLEQKIENEYAIKEVDESAIKEEEDRVIKVLEEMSDYIYNSAFCFILDEKCHKNNQDIIDNIALILESNGWSEELYFIGMDMYLEEKDFMHIVCYILSKIDGSMYKAEWIVNRKGKEGIYINLGE